MRLKNEVTVGIVVVAALVFLLMGAYWLSGRPWGEDQVELVAIFREAGQLNRGNPVNYRGVEVGQVTDIALAPGGSGVLVSMEVRPGLTLPGQPAVILAPASLFGDWQASLVSMNSQPDLEFATTADPDILPGASLPDITELTAVGGRIAEDLEILANRVELAFTEETAIKLRETVENVQEISEQLTGFVNVQTQTFDQVSDNVLSASQSLQQTAERADQTAARFQDAVDPTAIQAMMDNAQAATEELRAFTAALNEVDVAGLGVQLRSTLATADRVVGQFDATAGEIEPAVADARAAFATLNELLAGVQGGDGTLGRLAQDPALYEETQAAVATLRRFLADVQTNPERYIGAIRIFRE